MQNNLTIAHSNLTNYLQALSISASQKIIVASRWPWKSQIISDYPESWVQRVVLCLKTLRWDLTAQKKQHLDYTFTTLNIYKQAVQYEILASKPKWLLREREVLNNLQEWLNTIDCSIPFSRKQKKVFYEWAGCLDDTHSFIAAPKLINIAQANPEKAAVLIKQIQKELQQRIELLPDLANQAMQIAYEFFDTTSHDNPQILQAQDQVDRLLLDKPIDSLFNFFVTEKGRPELITVYQQVSKAASIWNQLKKEEKDTGTQKKLNEFNSFFSEAMEEYGPVRDIANGVAYSNLFNK